MTDDPQLPTDEPEDATEAEADPEDATEAEDYTPPAKAERKGYAVFNTTLGQYVSGVTVAKPSAKAAKALVSEDHDVEVREV